MDINSLLNSTKSTIDEYLVLFSLIEQNPELILSNVFKGKGNNLLISIINHSNELIDNPFTLAEFQDYLYSLLIPFLEKNLRGITISYKNNIFPAYLDISFNEMKLGSLDIYNNRFIMEKPDYLLESEKEIQKLHDKLEAIKGKMQLLEKNKENIFALAKSPAEIASMLFRNKHYKKKLINKYLSLNDEFMEIERAIVREKIRLENIENSFKSFEAKQESVADFFSRRYSYKIESYKNSEEKCV